MPSTTSASFTVSYDPAAKTISGAVFAMLLVIGLATGNLAVGILFAVILAAAWAWSPTGYSIGGGELAVHRPIGNVRFPVSGIREVRIAAPEDLSGSHRVFGSGGLFGYYGVFRNAKLGKSRWYITNRAHAVVAVSSAGTLLFSPDDVDGFLAWTRPAGSAAPARFTPQRVETSRPAAAWITVLVVIAATALAMAAMFYSPGLPAYTLTRHSLVIRDRFYPVTLGAQSIDMKNARVIDFAADPEWKPVARANGFGNAHYHSGFFRLSSGGEVRLYRADGTRVVLLPAKDGGDPVLLETREPVKFLAELRQEWGGGS